MILIVTIIVATFLIVLGTRMMSRPEVILYFIATVVSIVALNIHMGFTIYLSRIGLALIVTAIIVRGTVGVSGKMNWHIDSRFLILFAISLLVQVVSSLFAVSIEESLRQVLIYASMMFTFLAVLVLGTKSLVIIKAVKYYLAFAVVQGLVGIYQVAGGIMGWPMYQDLMVGLTVGNPRNLQGIFWFSGTGGDSFLPRAFGFLSDANHYAGYLVGSLLLALAVIAWNRRLSGLVLLVGGIGLVLSLSRSGILTLFVFGLPALIYLSRKYGITMTWVKPSVGIVVFCILLLLGYSLLSPFGASSETEGFKLLHVDIIGTLIERLSGMTSSEELSEGGGLAFHILTRLLAIDAWVNRPLLGVGMGVNAAPWYSEKYSITWRGAHSHHFDALGQTGLLGASLEWIFMGLVGVTMWRGLKYSRRDSEERAVLIGLLAAYVAIILGNLLYHYYLNGFVWFIMGCGVALSRTAIEGARAAVVETEDIARMPLTYKRTELAG